MKKRKWDESAFGQMTIKNICRLYSSDKKLFLEEEPPLVRAVYIANGDKKYTVRWNRYEPGANFSGVTIGSDFYILKGNCIIKIDEITLNLQAGDCFEFPECRYQFEVIGDEFFEFIAVFKIPKDFPFIDN